MYFILKDFIRKVRMILVKYWRIAKFNANKFKKMLKKKKPVVAEQK
jgi:hypothetical protein